MADLSRLVDDLDFLREDIYKQTDKCGTSLNMLQERRKQTKAEIEEQFNKLRADLDAKENHLLTKMETSFHNAGEVISHDINLLSTHTVSIGNLQTEADDMFDANRVLNTTDVSQLNSKYEVMQLDVVRIQDRKLCPVYKANKRSVEIVNNLDFGNLFQCKEFPPVGAQFVEPPPYTAVAINITEPLRFVASQGIDVKPAELTAIVWTHGMVIVTDKANKKVKFFTETGIFIHELLFPIGAPYGLAYTYTDVNGVHYFAVTIPTVRQIYILCTKSTAGNIPMVCSSFYTHIGYAGVAPGLNNERLVVTVATQSPRVDVIGYQGEIFLSVAVGLMGEPLFAVPRYVITNRKVIIVSDWRKNCVNILSSTDGKFVGAYRGTPEHALINPYDITVDSSDNIYIMDGKTGHIHIIDTRLKLLHVVKNFEMTFNPRLLAFDSRTNRIAITHGAGNIELVPARRLYKIAQPQSAVSSGAHGDMEERSNPPLGDSHPVVHSCPTKAQLGPPPPYDNQRCPSPGF